MGEATNYDGLWLTVDVIFPLFSFLKGGFYSGYKYLKLFGSSGQMFFSPRHSSTQNQKLGTEVLLKIPLDLWLVSLGISLPLKMLSLVPVRIGAFAYQALVYKKVQKLQGFLLKGLNP